jgi:hypothetical protein
MTPYTVEHLMESLQQVPLGLRLKKNAVGNLAAIDDKDDVIGYVDLYDGTWHDFSEES